MKNKQDIRAKLAPFASDPHELLCNINDFTELLVLLSNQLILCSFDPCVRDTSLFFSSYGSTTQCKGSKREGLGWLITTPICLFFCFRTFLESPYVKVKVRFGGSFSHFYFFLLFRLINVYFKVRKHHEIRFLDCLMCSKQSRLRKNNFFNCSLFNHKTILISKHKNSLYISIPVNVFFLIMLCLKCFLFDVSVAKKCFTG